MSKELSITFRYDADVRILEAARRVAARDGIYGFAMPAIANEANRVLGTVGRFKIAAFVDYLIDSSFAPLLAMFERENVPLSSDHAVESYIDQMMGRDPDIAPLVMQVRALAAARSANAYHERWHRNREAAVAVIANRIAAQTGVTDAGERAEHAVAHYLKTSARLTQTD